MGETGYSVMSDSRNGDAYRMQCGTAGKGRRYDDGGGNGGYGSASQFTAAFRRQYGITPAMYRKNA